MCSKYILNGSEHVFEKVVEKKRELEKGEV